MINLCTKDGTFLTIVVLHNVLDELYETNLSSLNIKHGCGMLNNLIGIECRKSNVPTPNEQI